MSSLSGDKSRFNRLRKQKLLRRKKAMERKQASANQAIADNSSIPSAFKQN